jgi:acyl dehydratase
MPLNHEALMRKQFGEVEQTYDEKATILYALGLGVGVNPCAPDELRLVYEQKLQALPTMAVVLGRPGLWFNDPALNANWRHVLHGGQELLLHRPVPVSGTIVGKTVVDDVVDKGPEKGAFVYTNRQISDKTSGQLIAEVRTCSVFRKDGGFGGPSEPRKKTPLFTSFNQAPDRSVVVNILPQAALIYRLSGDLNPLHVDPEVASQAGFERPILHGLCTYGIAALEVQRINQWEPDSIRQLNVRFSSPVYPGERLRIESWRLDSHSAAFRCYAHDRNVLVLDQGFVEAN